MKYNLHYAAFMEIYLLFYVKKVDHLINIHASSKYGFRYPISIFKVYTHSTINSPFMDLGYIKNL